MSTTTLSEHSSLTRRHFLTGAGVAAAGAAVLAVPAIALAAEDEAEVPATADTASAGRIFQGVELAIGRVVHNPDICSGCRTCEIVCAVAHEGKASSTYSRMFAFKDVTDACVTEVDTCKQCAGAECVVVCPTKALHVDPDTGARVIDEEKCIGCQLCRDACPCQPKRIKYDARKNVCFKCDLCGGEPQCVKFCPMGALTCSWIDYGTGEDEDSIFEVEITGTAAPYTHHEINTFKLEETASGLELQGVVWTSHATQFNVIDNEITVTADAYDQAGNLVASSKEAAKGNIPEMSSFKYTLEFDTSLKADQVAKIITTVDAVTITNAVTDSVTY